MAAMIKGKDANRLLMTGVGVFGATFVAAQATDMVDNSPNQMIRNYAREIVGAGLTLAGALMMGNKDLRILGIAVGGTGISTIASGLVRRARGATAAAQNGNGAQNDSFVQDGNNYNLLPSYPFGDGSVIVASDNGRLFNLI